MKIKYKPQPLWRDTPCTIPFICRNPAINRQPRFSNFSIYHKDDVHKPKNNFYDLQKPQLIIFSFRRKLKQTKCSMKFNWNVNSAEKPLKRKQSVVQAVKNPEYIKELTKKLYKVPQKTQYKHDLHGFRSSVIGNYNVKQIIESKSLERKNFTSGRRTDFSRPHNYYPGPGTYYRDNPGDLNATYLNLSCTSFEGRNKKSQIFQQSSNKSNQKKDRLVKEI